MTYEWNEAKNEINIVKHGVDFSEINRFDWEFSLIHEIEFTEGEERTASIGPIGDYLFVAVTTERGDITRVISLRRAVKFEIRKWREEFHHD